MENNKEKQAESPVQPSEGLISRRGVLAALGMAGVALAAQGLYSGSMGIANGNSSSNEQLDNASLQHLMNTGLCITTTIAELRSLKKPVATLFYYVRDRGQEGMFYYDAGDTSSLDNTGLVLVSNKGYRFKRIYENVVNVKWFGATGDGITDDWAAIQSAINLSNGRTLFFPQGGYALSQSLVIQNGICLVGEGDMNASAASAIYPNQANQSNSQFAVFTASTPIENAVIRNIRTYSGGYGFKFNVTSGASYAAKIKFEHCVFQEHAQACFSFLNGDFYHGAWVCEWMNCDFKTSKLGIDIEGSANVIRIENCNFELMHDGYVRTTAGSSIWINGGRFETVVNRNKIGFELDNVFSVDISHNYFENSFENLVKITDCHNTSFTGNFTTNSAVYSTQLTYSGGYRHSISDNSTLVGYGLIAANTSFSQILGNQFLNVLSIDPNVSFVIFDNSYEPSTVKGLKSKLGLKDATIENARLISSVNENLYSFSAHKAIQGIEDGVPFQMFEVEGGTDAGIGYPSKQNTSIECTITICLANTGGNLLAKSYKYLLNIHAFAGGAQTLSQTDRLAGDDSLVISFTNQSSSTLRIQAAYSSGLPLDSHSHVFIEYRAISLNSLATLQHKIQ